MYIFNTSTNKEERKITNEYQVSARIELETGVSCICTRFYLARSLESANLKLRNFIVDTYGMISSITPLYGNVYER